MVHILSSQLHSLQQIPTQHDMLPQHLVYKNELNREYVITLARNGETPWWWSEKIETCRRGFKCFKWKLYRCICWLIFEVHILIGRLVKLRKAIISFVMSVCLSVRMEQFGSHWADFHEILYLSILRKRGEKIQVSLKSDKNNCYFTWRPIYILGYIALRFS